MFTFTIDKLVININNKTLNLEEMAKTVEEMVTLVASLDEKATTLTNIMPQIKASVDKLKQQAADAGAQPGGYPDELATKLESALTKMDSSIAEARALITESPAPTEGSETGATDPVNLPEGGAIEVDPNAGTTTDPNTGEVLTLGQPTANGGVANADGTVTNADGSPVTGPTI